MIPTIKIGKYEFTLGQLGIYTYCIIISILFYKKTIKFDLKTICSAICLCLIISCTMLHYSCTFFNSNCGSSRNPIDYPVPHCVKQCWTTSPDKDALKSCKFDCAGGMIFGPESQGAKAPMPSCVARCYADDKYQSDPWNKIMPKCQAKCGKIKKGHEMTNVFPDKPNTHLRMSKTLPTKKPNK